MTRPLVSIIVPSLNAERFLPAFCDSVKAQTYGEFEVLIGDDGSTDRSCEVVEPYLKDPRFRLIKWPGNAGVHHRTYQLLLEAKGKYWANPGSDDLLEPDFLERRVAVMEAEADVIVAHGPGIYVDPDGQPVAGDYQDRILPILSKRLEGRTGGERTLEMLLQHNFVNTPAILVRMEATRQVLPFYSPAWWWLVDWHLWILLAATDGVFHWDPTPRHRYTIHQASNTHNPKRAGTRAVEGRLAPLVALGMASRYSVSAQRVWSKFRRPLYALWLRRAIRLKKEGLLQPWMLDAASLAAFGSAKFDLKLAVETALHSADILRALSAEKSAGKEQLFVVSGLAEINDPLFRK